MSPRNLPLHNIVQKLNSVVGRNFSFSRSFQDSSIGRFFLWDLCWLLGDLKKYGKSIKVAYCIVLVRYTFEGIELVEDEEGVFLKFEDILFELYCISARVGYFCSD